MFPLFVALPSFHLEDVQVELSQDIKQPVWPRKGKFRQYLGKILDILRSAVNLRNEKLNIVLQWRQLLCMRRLNIV